MAQTLLTLEDFRRIIGYNPWHFWQLANELTPPLSKCNALVYQHAWQNLNAAGRAEIQEAIERAENLLLEHLGYNVTPKYVSKEYVFNGCLLHYPAWPLIIELGQKKVSRIVTQSWLKLNNVSLNPAYTDRDSDGVKDTAKVTFTTGAPVEDLFLAFLPEEFSYYQDYSEVEDTSALFIRPLRQWIDSATNDRVFTGSAWQFAKPLLYEGAALTPGFDSGAAGVDTGGSFDPNDTAQVLAANLDIYQRQFSSENKATLVIESGGQESRYEVTATIANKTAGLVSIALANGVTFPCTCQWQSWPGYNQHIEISYIAGEEVKNWRTIVTRLALAELARPICGCQEANFEIKRWQEDLSEIGAFGGKQNKIPPEVLTNPLGPEAGKVYAWQQIKNLRIAGGVSI